ncbi:hypothetical protein EKO04_001029 [Ascochyta lentis]|uniref:MYND-type domain-containing protein n=1 Tax=Ascochyta lentis TaxID=205686 RepID=A0A8H7JC86_9PLEO|nr:hypothetical protein EKO04_001029 [Ascochyta lentis]
MAHSHGPTCIPPANPLLCAMCNEEGARCSGCLEVRYCSRSCQRSDWPVHKLVCKAFSEFSDASRPSIHHKRALVFAEDKDLPCFAWLHVQPREDNNEITSDDLEGKVPVPQLEPYLGTVEEFLSEGGTEREESTNPVLRRKIGHGITVAGRQRTNQIDSLPGSHRANKSLLAVDKELPEIWSGNVVAYGFMEDTERIQDLDLMDFRHVVDIIRHIYDHVRREYSGKIDGSTVTGAFIPCAAEEKLGCRVFEILPVSAAQCDAQSEVASPIMTRIGIPLVFRRLPLETRWRDRKLGLPRELIGWNPTLRPFDPTIPLCDRRHGVGSAVVVRKDGKPLCQTHVAAFVDYARNKVASYCHDNHETARGVLDSCTKEDFMVWYDGWKLQASCMDVDVPSPYDVEPDADQDLASATALAGME